ncbi:MAG TPA: hypothetical protein EYH31_04105 [Anaerolineae bacterium]|nr:hypothetical protein [Anaerolineae bacterium]
MSLMMEGCAGRRLVLVVRSYALMIIALHLIAPSLPEDRVWGIWPYTYLPPIWRWMLAGGTVLLIFFGPVRFRAGKLPCRLLPKGSSKPFLFASLAFLSGPLFYTLRIVHTRWGDAYILVHAIPHPDVRLTYNWQAPLDVFLHAKVWALGHRWFGWVDAMPAYWILSSIAGVAFIYTLAWTADVLGRDRTERILTFALVASLGSMQLFFGYIENYTFITLGTLLYLYLAVRCLRSEMDLLWPAVVLALSHAFHPSTLVLQPSLWYLAFRTWRAAQEPGQKKMLVRNMVKAIVPTLAAILGVVTLMESGGHGISAFLSSDFPGGGDHRWLVPLFHTTTRWEHYTLFSRAHLLDILNEQLLTAPFTLPIIGMVVGLAWKRIDWRDAELWLLVTAGGGYLLLTLLWNPDYGGRRDWDLFAPASIPLTLLAVWLLVRTLPDREQLRRAGLAAVVTSFIHTAAWIYQNTQPWEWPS